MLERDAVPGDSFVFVLEVICFVFLVRSRLCFTCVLFKLAGCGGIYFLGFNFGLECFLKMVGCLCSCFSGGCRA